MRLWLSLIFAACSSVYANHPANVFEKLGDYVPVLSFTETVSQAVVGPAAAPETVDNYSGKFRMVVDSDKLGSLNAASVVRIRIGEFFLDTTLGAASDYSAGGNMATFPIFDGAVQIGTVKAAWADEILSIKGAVKSRLLPQASATFLVPQLSEDERYFVNEATDVSMVFGELAGSQKIEATGKSTFRAYRIGPVATPVFEDTLWKISVSGALDFTAPAVRLLSPALNTNASPQRFVLSTSPDTDIVTIKVNTVEVTEPVAREPDPSKKPVAKLWDGLFYLGTGANTVEFTALDRSGNLSRTTLTLTHDFRSGVYSGILDTGVTEMTRTLVLKVRDGGAFTGTLLLGLEKLRLKGAFDANGMATFDVTRPRGGATVNFQLTLTPDDSEFISEPDAIPTRLSAVITDGSEFTIDAYRSVYDTDDVQVPLVAGYYTARIEPVADSGASEGTGYLSMSVGKTGIVRTLGKVADGTPFSLSSPLGGDGRLLIYSRLYKPEDGFVQGFLKFTPAENSGSTCEGSLRWYQPPSAKNASGLFPDGFSADCPVSGGIYLPGFHVFDGESFEDFPALGSTEVQISFLLGDFGDTALVREFDTKFDAKVLRLNAAPEEKMRLSIKNKTGILSGRISVAGHTSPAKKFFGIIVAQDAIAEGAFISKTDSGSIVIESR
jgi:hypothetical protein